MIIEFKTEHLDELMEIWLETSVSAHPFIPEAYWHSRFEAVKNDYVPMSESYLFEDDYGIIKGFISILPEDTGSAEPPEGKGGFIGALFVLPSFQGQGVGARLINYCKDRYDRLSLRVYTENESAAVFYENCGFAIEKEQMDETTGHREYIMTWSDDRDWCDLLLGIQC